MRAKRNRLSETKEGPTLLVDNFVGWSFPVLLIKDFYRYDVPLYGPIHVLTANQEDGLLKGRHRDAPLRCIGSARRSPYART